MFSQHEMFMIREDYNFLVKKWSNYLVVSNNLLFSHRRIVANYSFKHLLLRARHGAPHTNKGLNREFPLFNFLCPFAPSAKAK